MHSLEMIANGGIIKKIRKVNGGYNFSTEFSSGGGKNANHHTLRWLLGPQKAYSNIKVAQGLQHLKKGTPCVMRWVFLSRRHILVSLNTDLCDVLELWEDSRVD